MSMHKHHQYFYCITKHQYMVPLIVAGTVMEHHNHELNGTTSIINNAGHIQHEHNHCSSSHMHSMAFHFGFNETILFNFWVINNPTGLFPSTYAILINY